MAGVPVADVVPEAVVSASSIIVAMLPCYDESIMEGVTCHMEMNSNNADKNNFNIMITDGIVIADWVTMNYKGMPS